MILIAAAAVVMAACGGGDSEGDGENSDGDSTSAPSEAVAGGELVFAVNQEPGSLDPLSATTVNDRAIVANLYDSLVYLKPGLEVVPGLATDWSVNDDSTEFTFTIRDGVTFHNGDTLDANAVKAHFDRLLEEEPGTALAEVRPHYESAEVSGNDVTLTFSSPQPDLLLLLADPGGGISNAAYVTEQGEEARSNPMGSGPFVFKEWVSGSHVTLERNPDWTWGNEDMFGTSGPANLDALTFRFIEDPQTRVAALQTGEVQFVDLVPFHQLGGLQDDDSLQVDGAKLPGLVQGNYLNPSVFPTDDPAVREAAELATNQQEIIDTLYLGLVDVAPSPLSSDFGEHDASLGGIWEYDPERAAQVLEDAGWILEDDGIRYKDGQPLHLRITENKSWNDWVVALQAQLNAVGFDAEVVTFEGAGYYDETTKGTYEVPSMGSVSSTPTLLTRFFHSKHIGDGGLNLGAVDDPELDTLLDAIEVEADVDARADMVRDVQRIVMEKAYYLPMFELSFFIAYPTGVEGTAVDGTGYYKYFAGTTMDEG